MIAFNLSLNSVFQSPGQERASKLLQCFLFFLFFLFSILVLHVENWRGWGGGQKDLLHIFFSLTIVYLVLDNSSM